MTTKPDPRLFHTCKMHFVPNSIEAYKPFPEAKYYKHRITIECPQCHKQELVECTNLSNAIARSMDFPWLPKFPK